MVLELKPNSIQLNKTLKYFEESDRGVKLFFEDGTNVIGDI
jgi:hypothetical protein